MLQPSYNITLLIVRVMLIGNDDAGSLGSLGNSKCRKLDECKIYQDNDIPVFIVNTLHGQDAKCQNRVRCEWVGRHDCGCLCRKTAALVYIEICWSYITTIARLCLREIPIKNIDV